MRGNRAGRMTRRDMLRGCAAVGVLPLAACSAPPETLSSRSEIDALDQAIRGLGAGVDAGEAARAAEIAITYPLELRERYGVTDTALIHNAKVNMGLRPRGLCWHWADDLEARLTEEDFQTLDLHRAIANDTSILIDHSTVVISARGDEMEEGIVLDGWRKGGELFWSAVTEDPRYRWERRAVVFARRSD